MSLGGRGGGLLYPKCGWSICELILAETFENIGATQIEGCFESVFLKYLEMPEYPRALTMAAPKKTLNTTNM